MTVADQGSSPIDQNASTENTNIENTNIESANDKQSPQKLTQRLTIIGIGASAGGLTPSDIHLDVLQDPSALPQEEQQTLVQILTQLRLRSGQDFSGYREATILRRTARRQ